MDAHSPLRGVLRNIWASQWLAIFKGRPISPRKTVRASVLTRVSKFISGFGPHASRGSDAKIGVQRQGYGDMPNDNVIETWHGFATRVNSHLVLRKCPKGFTGYRCHFDYDYTFRIGGTEAREIAACLSAP